MKNVLIALAMTVALIAGPGVTAQAEAATYPNCSKVWVVGKTLPKTYKGCETRTSIVLPVWIKCDNGRKFTTFQDRKWAQTGKRIEKGGPAKYSKAYNKCLGFE